MSPPLPKTGKTTGTWDEIMDPNGDITLLVGKQKHKFRVARNILSLSSPVFAKMLAPDSHFMEAQVTDLPGDGTKHIGLFEDELESLTLVLRIMHHRTKDIPTQLSLDLLAKVASLCDKYDLLDCIRPWTASWCIYPMAKDDRRWLLVAFVFENTQAFREITKSLILNARTEFLKNSDIVTNLDGVPGWIMGQLRACREDALRKLAGIITRFSKKLIKRNAHAGVFCLLLEDNLSKRQVCDATALGDLATFYPKAIFPDPDTVDVNCTRDTESVTSYVSKLKDTRCNGKLIQFTQGKTTLSHSLCQPNARLLPEMQEIVNGVTGLCLDPPFQTFVTVLSGKTITIHSFPSDTIFMMKIKIREHEHIPIDQQRLVFGPMQLSNDLTLQHYKIAKDANMRLVLRVVACGCGSGEPKVWATLENAPQG